MAFSDPNKPFIARSIKTANSGQRIEINSGTPNTIQFFNDPATAPTEISPGTIFVAGNAGESNLDISAPTQDGLPPTQGHLELTNYSATGIPYQNKSELNLSFDYVAYRSTVNTDNNIRYDSATGVFTRDNDVWTNLSLAGTWADVAGQRAHYRKDVANTVWVEGVINGGAATTIGILPVGYRPSQTREVLLRGGNPGPVMCALQINPSGSLIILTNLAAAQARLPIDFSFTALS